MTAIADRIVVDSAVKAGLRDMLPGAIGVVPFATMIGVAIGESPMSKIVGYLGGLMVAGGSAHLAATASISVGASLVFTVATAWLVNARGLIYGAALGPHLRTQPRWFRWAAAYTLVDQIYALVSGVTARDDEYVRTYYLAAAALLWGAYMTGVGVGIVVGPVIPDAIPLSLAIPVMFTAMLVPALTDTPSWTAALVALTTALAGSTLPTGMGLVAGIVAGTVAGASVGGRDDV